MVTRTEHNFFNKQNGKISDKKIKDWREKGARSPEIKIYPNEKNKNYNVCPQECHEKFNQSLRNYSIIARCRVRQLKGSSSSLQSQATQGFK